MTDVSLVNWTPDAGPGIMAVQAAYAAIYPEAAVLPKEVYLHPAFKGGRNIYCAHDEHGKLVGYAPLFPSPASGERDAPHRIWAEVKVDPGVEHSQEVKDALFSRVLERAKEIKQTFVPGLTYLCFQYASSEHESIRFIMGRGFERHASVFRMACNLSIEIPETKPPAGLLVREWRMDTPDEQKQYIDAKNRAFPHALETLDGLQHFMRSDLWEVGTTFSAFAGSELVGSVMVYWDEKQTAASGKRSGFTENVFVLPAWRGMGLASHLLSLSLSHLKKHNLSEARLEVLTANANALRAYTNMGYRVTREEVQLCRPI